MNKENVLTLATIVIILIGFYVLLGSPQLDAIADYINQLASTLSLLAHSI